MSKVFTFAQRVPSVLRSIADTAVTRSHTRGRVTVHNVIAISKQPRVLPITRDRNNANKSMNTYTVVEYNVGIFLVTVVDVAPCQTDSGYTPG